MNKNNKTLAVICVIGVLVALYVCMHTYRNNPRSVGGEYGTVPPAATTTTEVPVATTTEPVLNVPTATTTGVVITSPIAGTAVTSPVTVTGKAPGGWFFEATAGLVVLNSANQVVSQARVDAQGDWMTAEQIPFTTTITYPASLKGQSGYIQFLSDNPSGLPENQKSFTIPVLFR